MTPIGGKSVLDGCREVVSFSLRGSATVVRGIGFWTGILLPLLYVPMLLLNHSLVVEVTTFAKLIALHVAALLVGRGHAGGVEDD